MPGTIITPGFSDGIAPIFIGEPWGETFLYLTSAGGTVDLASYTGRLHIVTSPYQGHGTLVTFTTTTSQMTLGTANPNITISVAGTATAALTEGYAYGYLTVTSGGGDDETLLWGPVQIRNWS